MTYDICFVINKAKSHVTKTLTAFTIILFAGLMAKNVNSNPEDTRTGHFDTGFFGFL
jgi:hypothetical protein